MRHIFVAVPICVASFAAFGGGASEQQFVSAADGTISLQQPTSAGVFTVELDLSSSKCEEAQSTLWWGTEKCPAENAIEKIRVAIDERQIMIPRSAFSDLAGVRRAALRARSDDVVLIIEGGQTSSGYRAELTFDAGELVMRIVRSRTFPDEVSETTIYRRKFSKEM